MLAKRKGKLRRDRGRLQGDTKAACVAFANRLGKKIRLIGQAKVNHAALA
jgi:hypothetical protein